MQAQVSGASPGYVNDAVAFRPYVQSRPSAIMSNVRQRRLIAADRPTAIATAP
jgi:hypothetical protein